MAAAWGDYTGRKREDKNAGGTSDQNEMKFLLLQSRLEGSVV